MKEFGTNALKGVQIGLGMCASLVLVWWGMAFAAAAWGALPNAGTTLSSAAWNDIVSQLNTLAGAIGVSGNNVTVGGTVNSNGFSINCANRIKTVSARAYSSINASLDADETGVPICGAGWHVCNADEAQVYGVAYGCDIWPTSWIVWGFPNSEYHRRSNWNGQDLTNCLAGDYPTWYGRYGNGYLWRVHCQAWTLSLPVACCKAL